MNLRARDDERSVFYGQISVLLDSYRFSKVIVTGSALTVVLISPVTSFDVMSQLVLAMDLSSFMEANVIITELVLLVMLVMLGPCLL